MLEYLLSLSLLIVVVLLIRGIFRKTVSPRAIYALWLVVVLRMLLPISLFEVDVTLPEFMQRQRIVQEEQSEQLPEDSEISADMQEQAPVSTPMQTAPTIPSQSPSQTTPEYPTVITPITPTTPVTPTVPADTTPVTPSTTVTDPEEVITPDETVTEVPEEPVSVNWKRIADLVWFCGVVIASMWVLLTSITYSRRLRKDRVFHRTVRGTKVYVSEYAGVPCIAGLIPSIYITPEAANSKSEILIIIHEHVHIRHGDHIWSIIRALALIIFWWNPLVWVAATVSKQDAELACDDTISSRMNDAGRLKYANILIDTIPQKHRYAVGLGSAPMKERILMLTKKQKNRWISLILAIVLAVSAVGCSFVSLNEKTGEDSSNDKIGIITENLSDFLTEEQIALYEKAGVIYPLFNGNSDSINILHLLLEGASFEAQTEYIVANQNTADDSYKIDNITYRPSYGEYDTFDEFKSLCLSVFTEEYFEELNTADPYSSFIDHNGKLYNIDAARGGAFGYAPDEFPDEYEVVEMSDDVIVFTVTGHYKSSNVDPDFTLTEETFTVKIVLTENGWRFAKFVDAGLDEPPSANNLDESVPNEVIEYTKKLAKYFRDPVESVTELREHQSLWEFLVNSIYDLHENDIVTLSDVTEKDYYPQYHIPYNYMHKASELLLGIENGLPEKLMSEDYHWLKDQDAFLYSPFSPPMYVTECIHSESNVNGTIYVTIKISRIEEKEALAVNTYALQPVDDPEFGKLYQLLSITGETFSQLMKDHSERISLYCTGDESSGWAKHFRINFGEHEAYISPKNGALISITWPPELYCMDIAVPTLPADGIDDAVIILTTGTGTGVHTEEAYVLSGADGKIYSFIEPYTMIENLVERDKNGAAWIIDPSGNRIDLPDNAYFNQNYKFYIENGCLYAKVLIGYGVLQYTSDDFVIRYASNTTWEYNYANPNNGKSIDSSLTDLLAMPASELSKTYGPMTLAWSEAGPGQPVYQLGGKYGVYTVYHATDMNETIPDNRCADEIIVMNPYSDGDICGLCIGDDISESTAGIYWSDAWYSVASGGLFLSAKIDGYILNVGLGVSSEESKLLPNEAEATAEEWAAWERAFAMAPFGKISSMRIRKELNDHASDFANTQMLSIPNASLTTEMERIEENELFPAEKYTINVTGMSVPVKLYMQLDSVAAIEAHGHYVEIKELFDIYGNCSFKLFESGGAVVIEGGYYEIGDVYIISPERCSEMHPGTGSSYWLLPSDNGSLKYLHKHNSIATIIQAGALNAAVAYDEFLFASGDASIKNGELFFAEPTESYTMSDRYDLDKEFRDLWSDEYSSIEEKFAENLSARNVQQYGQGPFIGYVADKETPWITLYTSKTGTYVGRIPYEIFHDWVATDREREGWQSGWEPEYVRFYYAEFGNFRWAAAHLTDTTMGNGRKNVATSSDGGKTWSVGSTMDDYGGNHVLAMGFISDKIAFMSFDPDNEFYDPDEDGVPYTGPAISRTTDGGKTWERLEFGVVPSMLESYKLKPGIPFYEGEVLLYPIVLYSNGVAMDEVFLMSYDNGLTWKWGLPNDSGTLPTDEEILAEYEKATKLDNIFALSISALVGSVDSAVDKPLQIGNVHYFESKKYSSFDELRNELLTVFSKEIADEMLDSELIKNVDGKLYAALADGGDSAPISYRNEIGIIPISDTKLTLRVTVKVTDWYLRTYGYYASGQIIDTVNVDFTYEKIGDNWVFTEFPYIRGVYDSKLREKYTEYEFEFGKLVLPAKYDGQFIFKTNVGKYLLTAAYDPHGDGQYSDDQVFKIWRIPLGEEIPKKDGLTVTNAIGYDDKYVYMMTSGVSTSRSVTYESGFDDAVCECVTAIVTYTPHVNGWQYFGVLEHLIPIEQNTIHQSILENKAAVYSPDLKSDILLSDYLKSSDMDISKYIVLDLDESGAHETILWLEKGENEYLGFLILNNKNEKTYAHLLYYRQFADLKTDGTFKFSGGVSNHGIGRLYFSGDTCTIDKIAYCESADNQNISYFIENKSVSKEIFDAYMAIHSQKPSVSWYDYTYGT